MKTRAVEDRRQKNIQVEENRRKSVRRYEDRSNIASYYIVLGAAVLTLGFIGVISYIWG